METNELMELLFAERVLALAMKMAVASEDPKAEFDAFIAPALGAIRIAQREIRLQPPFSESHS